MCEFQKLLCSVHVPKKGGGEYFFKKEIAFLKKYDFFFNLQIPNLSFHSDPSQNLGRGEFKHILITYLK